MSVNNRNREKFYEFSNDSFAIKMAARIIFASKIFTRENAESVVKQAMKNLGMSYEGKESQWAYDRDGIQALRDAIEIEGNLRDYDGFEFSNGALGYAEPEFSESSKAGSEWAKQNGISKI